MPHAAKTVHFFQLLKSYIYCAKSQWTRHKNIKEVHNEIKLSSTHLVTVLWPKVCNIRQIGYKSHKVTVMIYAEIWKFDQAAEELWGDAGVLFA